MTTLATSVTIHASAVMLMLACTFSEGTSERPAAPRAMVLLAPPPMIRAAPRATRLTPEPKIPNPPRRFLTPIRRFLAAPPRELTPVPALQIPLADAGPPLMQAEGFAHLAVAPPPPLRTDQLAPFAVPSAASPNLLSSPLRALRSSGFEQIANETPSRQRVPPLAGTFDDATKIPAGFQTRRALVASAPPDSRSVEILWKPRPAYTEEARRQRIEGEVLLEILFAASGQLRVLATVRGLGHGLNESAIAAAEAIRYRPAERKGVLADSTAIVHIVFQLAY